MALNFEYFDAAGTAVAEGIYIPVSNLPGVTADELEPGDNDKESKITLAIYRALVNYIAPLTSQPLGLLMSASGLDTLTQTYSMTHTYMVNHSNGTVSQVPLGSGSGMTIVDVFPGAAKVAAAGAISGAGILIPTAELAPYGAPAQGDITLTADSRQYWQALSFYLAENVTLRSSTVASAIVNKNVGLNSSLFPPSEWTEGSSPLSSVPASQLSKRSFFTRTYEVTIELALDHNTQTFDVRHVIAA
ncbi:hypothetical protein [Thermosynechococcus sp. FA-CM-4201]